MNNKIDMKTFEKMAETSTKEDFHNVIKNLKNSEIDEEHGRVEGFDFNNIGNFHEDSIENYLKELSKIKSLNNEEILELLKKVKNGDSEARELLIEGLLKLVAKIALKYAKVGASFIELVQEGLMGIVIAIEKYELNSDIDFMKYLEFWIKFAMIHSNKKTIDDLKTPVTTYFKHLKVEMYKDINKEKEFNEKDIKETLNMEVEEFENLEKINEYGFLINEEDRNQMKQYNNLEEIDKELEKAEKLMSVSNMVNKFTNEEIKILDLYYGLSGKRKYYEEIGKMIGLEPDKVKEEIDKLMVKLKYNGKREWINEN